MQFYTFETNAGWFCIIWISSGVMVTYLPLENHEEVERRVSTSYPEARSALQMPPWLSFLVQEIKKYYQGKSVDFSHVKIDQSGWTNFQVKVYSYLRTVPRGTCLSYKQLAIAIGKPNAARAVGRAMATNPVPLIIPCHRVLASGGRLGGFSGSGGTSQKAAMLDLEHYASPFSV